MPASNTITQFLWAEQEEVRISLRSQQSIKVGFSKIREYVTEELNPENQKGVELVEVKGPFPGLPKDLVLVDTPGAASLHEYHDRLLLDFVPRADAVIFLASARMPLDQDEIDLLKQVKSAEIGKIFFAINRIDETNEADNEAAFTHNKTLLSQIRIDLQNIYRISAKKAYQGDLAKSNLTPLIADIQRLLQEQKGKMIAARFISRVGLLVQPITQGIAVELSTANKTAKELEDNLRQLRETKHTMKIAHPVKKAEFLLGWNCALDNFCNKLCNSRRRVISDIEAKIDKTSSFGVAGLIKELPTLIVRSIEKQVEEPGKLLEKELHAACNKLEAAYAPLDLRNIDKVHVDPKSDNELIWATTKGTLAIGGGALLPSILNSLLVAGLPTCWGFATISQTVTATVMAAATPISLVVMGIGTIITANSWRIAKQKQKTQIPALCREQINSVFEWLQHERVAEIRAMGETIVSQYQLRLNCQLATIESAILNAQTQKPDESKLVELRQLQNEINRLLAKQKVCL